MDRRGLASRKFTSTLFKLIGSLTALTQTMSIADALSVRHHNHGTFLAYKLISKHSMPRCTCGWGGGNKHHWPRCGLEKQNFTSTDFITRSMLQTTRQIHVKTRICAAEMAVRYAALSACRKVRVIVIR